MFPVAPSELQVRSDPPATPSGVRIPARDEVVPEAALLATINVYRAVSLLSLGAAQLTADVWRGDELIPRPSLIRRPDVNMRWRPWVKQNMASLALTGNAYWRLTRNDRHEVTNIQVLDPHECQPTKEGVLHWSAKHPPLQPHEFRHLKLLSIPGQLLGLGPIQAARMELQGALKTTRYGSEIHDTSTVPSGVLKSDQLLTPEQAGNYKARWDSREPHSVAVLGQGLDYKPMLLSPKDAQFIESRRGIELA